MASCERPCKNFLMKNFILVSLLLVSSVVSASAPQLAVGGGIIINRPDIKYGDLSGTGMSAHEETSTSFTIGARVLMPLSEKLSFRTGLALQEKVAEISYDFSGVSAGAKVKVLEFAIPLNLQYQIHEKFSAYGGYIMDLPINQYCDPTGALPDCQFKEAAKVTHNLNIGGSFHLAEKLDLELSYQHPMKAVLNDVKIYTWLLQGFYKF